MVKAVKTKGTNGAKSKVVASRSPSKEVRVSASTLQGLQGRVEGLRIV